MQSKSLKTADAIPSFVLRNQYNEETESHKLLDHKALVLYFYPKNDTPGCTAEACAFRDQFEVFTEAGARVVGISADHPASHKSFAEKHNLPFLLLSDEDNAVRNQFGVPKSLFGLLPGRVTYIIDQKGIVRHVFSSQLNVKKHITESLQVINSL